jgi:hypothetical protein
MRPSAWIVMIGLAALPVGAQEAWFQIQHQQDSLILSGRLDGVETEEILSALEEGLESEITFQIRVYEKAQGFFSFFGDKLIIQDAPSFRANLDRHADRYVIKPPEGEESLFSDKNAFLTDFLRLERYTISGFEPQRGKEYYLLARIRLVPARLIGPLAIISLFFRTGHTTDWQEMTLDTGGAG